MLLNEENKYQIMAAILNKEFKYSQASIAQLMKVQQSTISVWVRIGSEMLKNQMLEKEVQFLRSQIQILGYSSQKTLDNNIIDVISSN